MVQLFLPHSVQYIPGQIAMVVSVPVWAHVMVYCLLLATFADSSFDKDGLYSTTTDLGTMATNAIGCGWAEGRATIDMRHAKISHACNTLCPQKTKPKLLQQHNRICSVLAII